ncbi:MAG: hypothetical protein IH626_16935 [Rhodospirillales bacterium]|nr:hypothetical protein [Rhodospirillales bacterium]
MDTKPRLPGSPATEKTEDLPLWSSLHPYAHTTADAENILALLGHLPLDGRLEPPRVIAIDGTEEGRQDSARASLALARLSFDEKNRHFSNNPACTWLWRAAQRGSVTGALMLACALAGRAKMLERMAGPKDATSKRRVTAIRSLACDWLNGVPSVWQMDPELGSLPSAMASELRQPSLHAGPTRVIIGRWAFERGNTEMEAFRALAQPVPLVGGDRDPSSIIEQLHREFPWMETAIDRIADDLVLCGLAT